MESWIGTSPDSNLGLITAFKDVLGSVRLAEDMSVLVFGSVRLGSTPGPPRVDLGRPGWVDPGPPWVAPGVDRYRFPREFEGRSPSRELRGECAGAAAPPHRGSGFPSILGKTKIKKKRKKSSSSGVTNTAVQ